MAYNPVTTREQMHKADTRADKPITYPEFTVLEKVFDKATQCISETNVHVHMRAAVMHVLQICMAYGYGEKELVKTVKDFVKKYEIYIKATRENELDQMIESLCYAHIYVISFVGNSTEMDYLLAPPNAPSLYLTPAQVIANVILFLLPDTIITEELYDALIPKINDGIKAMLAGRTLNLLSQSGGGATFSTGNKNNVEVFIPPSPNTPISPRVSPLVQPTPPITPNAGYAQCPTPGVAYASVQKLLNPDPGRIQFIPHEAYLAAAYVFQYSKAFGSEETKLIRIVKDFMNKYTTYRGINQRLFEETQQEVAITSLAYAYLYLVNIVGTRADHKVVTSCYKPIQMMANMCLHGFPEPRADNNERYAKFLPKIKARIFVLLSNKTPFGFSDSKGGGGKGVGTNGYCAAIAMLATVVLAFLPRPS